MSSDLDEYGRTPLHYAAGDGDTRKVASLIERGTDVNAQDIHGWIALHGAAQMHRPEVVEQLVKAGAQIDLRSTDHGNTPLFVAVVSPSTGDGQQDGPTIRKLLELGADPDSANNIGKTPRGLATIITSHDLLQYFAGY